MTEPGGGYSWLQWMGLLLGPALFVATRTLFLPAGLSPPANAVLATTLWIAAWWITEAVPIPVTSLLPVVLFPLQGVVGVVGAAAPYADPIVFLFLGGFMLALAIERWGLHERIALNVLVRAGNTSRRLVLAFMVATAFLSMWVSNTATAMMMLPIGMAVVAEVEALRSNDGSWRYASPAPESLEAGSTPTSNFAVALLLGIAYAASIGGVATLIGTPPNAVLAGVARSMLGVEIGFLDWMKFGLPISTVFLVLAWVVLTRLHPPEFTRLPGGPDAVESQLRELGGWSKGERRVAAVFGLVVLGWVTRPYLLEPLMPGVTDTAVALAGAVLLYLVPADRRRGEFLLDWQATTRVPWGVLLLFGAGFSLAHAFRASGLDQWIAGLLTNLHTVDLVWVLLVVSVLIVFLTEVTSNTATSSLFIPVMAGLAGSLGASPLSLMATVAVAASFAFMLPVATPPNAIVFGSGRVSIPQMSRVGFWLNIIGILLVTMAAYAWLPIVWGL